MSCCLSQDAKSSQLGIGGLPGQTSLELWVKNIVAVLFLIDNIPGYHVNGRMLKVESFEILQWMWGVFSIMYMNSYCLPQNWMRHIHVLVPTVSS